VSAVCDDAPALTLAIDRPVDVSAMDVSLIRVDNGVLGFSYVGYETPVRVGPTIVQILLTGVDDYTGPGMILTAGAGNGIVPADGHGAAWAGVSGLLLPYLV
jgi:hypothetical protein